MNLQRCYNVSEDLFPLPPHIKESYGAFGFPAPAVSSRPYIASNFVMGLDGRASFRELKGRADGKTVSTELRRSLAYGFSARAPRRAVDRCKHAP